ncbi:MAG: condensation domain-containing protein, partial [Pseudomonadota bacterium]
DKARFVGEGNAWTAEYLPPATGLDDTTVIEYGEGIELPDPQAHLDYFSLEKGRLFRAVFSHRADGRPVLTMIAHHIVVDGVSWRRLVADVAAVLKAPSGSDPAALLARPTSSLQAFGERLRARLSEASFCGDAAHWHAQVASANAWQPAHTPDGAPVQADALPLRAGIDARRTRLLLEKCNQLLSTTTEEVLLAGVLRGLLKRTDHQTFVVDIEHHGRDLVPDYAAGDAVGWFTHLFPVRFSLPAENTATGALICVKETLRGVLDDGLSFSALAFRDAAAADDARPAFEAAPIAFNYLGQIDRGLGDLGDLDVINERVGTVESPARAREHALVFNLMIAGGELVIECDGDARFGELSDLQALMDDVQSSLESLIDDCASRDDILRTPSDFPLAQVSASQLNEILGQAPDLEDLYPSTPMQQGMLFHSTLVASDYVTQVFFDVPSDLDVEHFRTAWQDIAQAHAVFRTQFVGEALHQAVLTTVKLPWSIRVRSADGEMTEPEFQALLQDDRQAGFTLDRAPLMRFHLVDTPQRRKRFVWTSHHALLDGWSVAAVLSQVIGRY